MKALAALMVLMLLSLSLLYLTFSMTEHTQMRMTKGTYEL